MRDGGFGLGGEQSGHVIMLEHATTGDGLLTALQLLATAARQALPLADAGRGDDQVPAGPGQRPRRGQGPGRASAELASAVAAAKEELGTSGRVLVRPSGTEPAVRVMVEAVEAEQAQRTADRLAAAVRAPAKPRP